MWTVTARRVFGYFREQYASAQLEPIVQRSLGREYEKYSLEDAASHTGLFHQATYDIPTIQLHLRPVLSPQAYALIFGTNEDIGEHTSTSIFNSINQ